MSAARPLYPQYSRKRTCRIGSSVRTHAPQQTAPSFDHVVGAASTSAGTVSTSCFAVLRFQNELEMSCMTCMSAGRCPFEDLTNTALAPQSRGVDDGGPARNLVADIGCKLVRPALERIEP